MNLANKSPESDLEIPTRILKDGKFNNRELRRSADKALGKRNADRSVVCKPTVLWMMRQAGIIQRGQRRVRPSTVLAFIRSQSKPEVA